MKQLLTIVVPRIATEWDKVAHHLELHICTIIYIQQHYGNNPEKCCCHMLEEWISTDQGLTPKSWSTLLSVFKQIKALTKTSGEIKNDLQQ